MTTTPTLEALERAAADLRTTIAAAENGRAPASLLRKQTDDYVAMRKAYENGQSRPSSPSATSAMFDAAGLSLGGAGEQSIKRSGDHSIREFAPLNFRESDLDQLHKGVVNRQMVTKAAITSTTAPMSAVGSYQRDEVYGFARDMVRIADLIPAEMTESPVVFNYRSLAAASAATVVAEGGDKPESSPTWESITTTLRKIAHFSRVNDEVIADHREFLRIAGEEMIAGLIHAENGEILNGSGVAPHVQGLTTATGVVTIGSAGTDIDAIYAAVNTIRTTAFLEPDVVIMHPNDFASVGFALAKDSTGQYLLGDPMSATRPMLWGIPVVLTTRQTENTAVVANLKQSCRIYVRQPPTLEVQPGGGTAEFIANQTLIRAEERIALVVLRPTAIVLVGAV